MFCSIHILILTKKCLKFYFFLVNCTYNYIYNWTHMYLVPWYEAHHFIMTLRSVKMWVFFSWTASYFKLALLKLPLHLWERTQTPNKGHVLNHSSQPRCVSVMLIKSMAYNNDPPIKGVCTTSEFLNWPAQHPHICQHKHPSKTSAGLWCPLLS